MSSRSSRPRSRLWCATAPPGSVNLSPAARCGAPLTYDLRGPSSRGATLATARPTVGPVQPARTGATNPGGSDDPAATLHHLDRRAVGRASASRPVVRPPPDRTRRRDVDPRRRPRCARQRLRRHPDRRRDRRLDDRRLRRRGVAVDRPGRPGHRCRLGRGRPPLARRGRLAPPGDPPRHLRGRLQRDDPGEQAAPRPRLPPRARRHVHRSARTA